VSLEKLLELSGAVPPSPDLDADLLLAAQVATRELLTLLAAADDDEKDGGKDDDDDDGGGGGEHSSHATFKALVKRKVPAKRAASMCARSDKSVKASQLAAALGEILAGQPGRDLALVTLTPESETAGGRKKAAKAGHALPDGSFPIEDRKHLHSAAVLAASGHGNAGAAKALIRKRAREMGVDVNSLPGFGGDREEDGEKAAASMLALAARMAGPAAVAMHHASMTGTHSHAHAMTATHEHEHQHYGDNNHDGGPLHRPGSEPRRAW
jgi:hypothetical protein